MSKSCPKCWKFMCVILEKGKWLCSSCGHTQKAEPNVHTLRRQLERVKELGDSMALDLTDTHSKRQWRKYTEK